MPSFRISCRSYLFPHRSSWDVPGNPQRSQCTLRTPQDAGWNYAPQHGECCPLRGFESVWYCLILADLCKFGRSLSETPSRVSFESSWVLICLDQSWSCAFSSEEWAAKGNRSASLLFLHDTLPESLGQTRRQAWELRHLHGWHDQPGLVV